MRVTKVRCSVFFLLTLFLSIFSPLQFSTVQAQSPWALEETFNGTPSSPSQNLLPRSFDYVVTHRRDSGDILVDYDYDSFPADHGHDCRGPDPALPLSQIQHQADTSHLTNGTDDIDKSFFICNDHMMSSMGHVSGYSVSSFYPKQEFNFSDGGVLEFDVNLSTGHSRSWWEVMIVPRDQLKVGAAIEWLPISEKYPKDRIVLRYDNDTRSVEIGGGALPPAGIIKEDGDWRSYKDVDPQDPARIDRRIRRKMRIELSNNQLKWYIRTRFNTLSEVPSNMEGSPNLVQLSDGVYDLWQTSISSLPITQGVVVFKTHAYTPNKDGNNNLFTFHWDNIRFDGPVVGKFEAFEAKSTDVVNLQSNGSVPIGSTQTIPLNLPHIGNNPVLFGQVHNPIRGQVLLSINGKPNIPVEPIDYGDPNSCYDSDWKSFYVPIDPSLLQQGENTFKWTVGPRNCSGLAPWDWDGYAIKGLQVQFDLSGTATPTPAPSNTPVPTNPLQGLNADFNADSSVNVQDFTLFLNYFATQNSKGDIDGDTVVSIKDFNILVRYYGT